MKMARCWQAGVPWRARDAGLQVLAHIPDKRELRVLPGLLVGVLRRVLVGDHPNVGEDVVDEHAVVVIPRQHSSHVARPLLLVCRVPDVGDVRLELRVPQVVA